MFTYLLSPPTVEWRSCIHKRAERRRVGSKSETHTAAVRIHSSGAVRESIWPSWAVPRPNEPYHCVVSVDVKQYWTMLLSLAGLSCYKYHFCRDKKAKLLLRQTGKTFVATNSKLFVATNRQIVCCDKQEKLSSRRKWYLWPLPQIICLALLSACP